MNEIQEARFWSKVDASGDCWVWTGTRAGAGYGRFFADRTRSTSAHRISYELLVGPIPDGLTIDHLCRNPPCVNPDHLEPVTMRENIMRGIAPTAWNAKTTVCRHGHEFTPENTYITTKGWRECRPCKRGLRRREMVLRRIKRQAARAALAIA